MHFRLVINALALNALFPDAIAIPMSNANSAMTEAKGREGEYDVSAIRQYSPFYKIVPDRGGSPRNCG